MPDAATRRGGRVAIVVKGYPRLSETFIAQEIHGLQTLGQRQLIVSLRHPYDPATHPVHDRIEAPVLYLPEYLHQEPARVAAARAAARRLTGYPAAYAAFRADLRRDPTTNRWRRFGQACTLAAELPDDVTWLYDHYLHTPADVTRYVSLMTGLRWSVSAHAKDIYTTPDWQLQAKLPGGGAGSADWCITCTRANLEYLQGLAGAPERVSLVYHGLDLDRFPAPPARPARDGTGDPVRLLSVGRAVRKKGFDTLIDALARLPRAIAWTWTLIGKGEDLAALQARADAAGIADRTVFAGAQAQAAVFDAYRAADLFVLPSRIAEDGDRDGLPNVLMEAAAFGLCPVATPISGIPELVEDGRTGRLIPPNDPAALAEALAALIADPGARQSLGAAAERRVRADFSFRGGLAALADRFGLPVPG